MRYNEDKIKFYQGMNVKLLNKTNSVVIGVLNNRDEDYVEIINENKTISVVNKCNIIRICKAGDIENNNNTN